MNKKSYVIILSGILFVLVLIIGIFGISKIKQNRDYLSMTEISRNENDSASGTVETYILLTEKEEVKQTENIIDNTDDNSDSKSEENLQNNIENNRGNTTDNPEEITENASKINATEDTISEDAFSANTDTNSNQLDISQIEGYKGIPHIEINGNVPLFTDEDKKNLEFENYSELDALGRCGVAFACISIDTMPTEERTSIGMIKPSGWHTVKYNDLIDGNYLYNRCHLIGFQLAGENDNEKNLITGTRYLNVEGMLPFENKVSDYVKKTKNHVLYRVTPCFYEDNPLVSGVTIEAYSVEDDGKGICFYVYLYNVQPGIIIDYKTGDSERDPNYAPAGQEAVIEEEETLVSEPEVTTEDASVKYILNTNTHKFHYPTCSSVSDMKEKNKKESNESREEIINQGYVPCKRCNP